MHDLIIIGGGPAGITAGIYASRKKIKTLLVAKNFIGQVGISGVIENWPGEKNIIGPELMMKFEEHLKVQEIKIVEEEVIGIEVVVQKGKNIFTITTDDNSYKSKSLIIATGRRPKELNIPGEKEYTGKGVVYCTTCDAPLFKNKKVLVVGGGNTGFEAAIELTDYAKEVLLFEASSKFNADEILQEKAKIKKIKTYINHKVTKITGDNFLRKIYFEKDGKEQIMDGDGLFVQIGSMPITKIVDGLVDFNTENEVIINPESCETKTIGLFAAGDVTNIKYKQIVTATGEGAKAALSTYDYLKK